MLDAGGGPQFVQEAAAVCRRQWLFAGRVPPSVRRNRRYDFGNRFEFGLKVILDALTRSIPDNGGDHSPDRRPFGHHTERTRAESRPSYRRSIGDIGRSPSSGTKQCLVLEQVSKELRTAQQTGRFLRFRKPQLPALRYCSSTEAGSRPRLESRMPWRQPRHGPL
jgi:hypothetical protein